MATGLCAPGKALLSRCVGLLATMVLAIVAVVGSLVAAPAVSAAPDLTSWRARLAAPAAPTAVTIADAGIAAAFSQLVPAPPATSSTPADVGYVSDLQSLGLPTDDPAFVQSAIQLAHVIVDNLHANPTFRGVSSVAKHGLDAGFTNGQVAGVMVSAAKWYGPDLLPLLKAYADAGGGTRLVV